VCGSSSFAEPQEHLIFDGFNWDLLFGLLHFVVDEVNVVLFQSLWHWVEVVGVVVRVKVVVESDDFVVLNQPLEVMVLDVLFVSVQSGFISNLMRDKLSVVS